ncbi:MAG: M28 family peptidase [Janthinobacterium lividum]
MTTRIFFPFVLWIASAALFAQTNQQQSVKVQNSSDAAAVLVNQLELGRYKATIKGLTQFGDRRQGTDRNRAAVDWIETQLKSYGCATERIRYNYQPPEAAPSRAGRPPVDRSLGPGGSRRRGIIMPDTVNSDPMKQPDERLRALNMQPSSPGLREEVYCTKVGSKHPDQMYILGAHMDGIGWGEAANDDGSGTALVMELARILNDPKVQTDVSIRFALWNNEETGLNGAQAYVTQRKSLQGLESPAGSGKFPEPKWLGMIQHDMMMFDHGMPLKDGTMSKQQRPEADVNIEYQSTSKYADAAMAMAHRFQLADDKYATDYPANVGPHMTNTDSSPFMDLTPALSVREVERGAQMGSGWDPQHHQPTDVYSFYTDDDFRLGLNAAQTTLGAIAVMSGAVIVTCRNGNGADAHGRRSGTWQAGQSETQGADGTQSCNR